MRQAILASNSTGVGTRSGTLPAGAPQNAFVINLCASTTPVALTPPDHAGLRRFTFFVSRRREEGRERFRLHMGYFDTQEEAEKLLDIVREIYPGAWASLAPGQRLRAAAAAAEAEASVAHAAAPAPNPTPAPATPAVVARPVIAARPPMSTPKPAPISAPPPVAAARRAPAPPAPEAPRPAALEPTPPPAPIAQIAFVEAASLTLVPDAGRRLPGNAAARSDQATAQSLSNVRAAIASLGDSGEHAPVLRPIPELKPALGSRLPTVHAAPNASRGGSPVRTPSDEVSGARALSVLEGATSSISATVRMPPGMVAGSPSPARTEVEDSDAQSDKPYFAVQLMWSVQPIDAASVPQLAIFSAYTLYGAEGNRDGRRWYGLRLGFFTDAVSAKQVAHYVRSEFATVSVVPVTLRERERAKLAASRPPTAPVVATKNEAPAKSAKTEFQFIEDKEPQAAASDARPKTAGAKGLPPRAMIGSRPSRGAPGKRAKLRTGSQVHAKAKSKPMSLEETLEILGAGELKVDDGREATINDSGVRHLKLEPVKGGKPSKLGRLFERLSERLGT